MAAGIEGMVAWRHLRDADPRAKWTLLAGGGLFVLAAVAITLSIVYAPGSHAFDIFPRSPMARIAPILRVAGLALAVPAFICLGLGVLFRLFSSFTAFSIFCAFLGTFAPIVALSIMSSFENDLKTKIRGTKADVVISAGSDQPFTDYEAVRQRLLGLPNVVGASPFIEAEIMVRSGSNPASAILRGIDPRSSDRVFDLPRILREGKMAALEDPSLIQRPKPRGYWGDALGGEKAGAKPADPGPAEPPVEPPAKDEPPSPSDEAVPAGKSPPAVFLGEELYKRTLRVYTGDDVDLVCPLCGIGPAGPMPKSKPFRVAGHFYSGMYEYDSKLLYVSLADAQRFLEMKGEVTGIDVRTTTPEAARGVADAASAMLGPRYEVAAWEDLNKALFAALKVEKMVMFIVLTLIALVGSFPIVTNLFMLVTAKAREVAMLKTMGARDQAIRRTFLFEGLYIGALGVGLGAGLGVGACKLLAAYGLPLLSDVYYIETLPVVVRPHEVAIISALAFVLCALASIYPALLAARLKPVEGLRYE